MATIQDVKTKIQNLINQGNEATGNSDVDLTSVVATLVEGYGQGDSSGAVVEKAVNFWDYDGTLLYSYTLVEAKAMTKLPDLPVHEEQTLVYANEWSESLSSVNGVVGFLDIYAKYKPIATNYTYASLFYFDIDNYKSLSLGLGTVSGWSYIHWGDGATSTINSTTYNTFNHTYEKAGKYTVVILGSGGIAIGYDSSKCFICDTKNRFNLLSCCLSSVDKINTYGFQRCYKLKYFFGSSTTSNNYVFSDCSSLRLICNRALISNYSRYNCFSIVREDMNAVSNANISFPTSYTCGKLKVKQYNFNCCPYGVREIFITNTSVPTLSSTVSTTNLLNNGTKIYVSDNLVDSYKTANKWSVLADYIFPISEYTDE